MLNNNPRFQPLPFQPTEDVVSSQHEKYRTARSFLAIGHLEMFEKAAKESVYAIKSPQLDCDAMLAGINTGDFRVPLYMTRFVYRTLKKMRAQEKRDILARAGMIVDNFARSDKQRRGQSVVGAEISSMSLHHPSSSAPAQEIQAA